MPPATFEILISGDELGRRLGVSSSTIERWIHKRLIPSYAFGKRCVRFDYQEARAALRKFERPAARCMTRGNYQPRRKPPKARFEAEQLELPFGGADPNQMQLDLGVDP